MDKQLTQFQDTLRSKQGRSHTSQTSEVSMSSYMDRISRPRWQKSLSNIEDLEVPLERNVYGHQLAGLLRDRQFEGVLLEFGWNKYRIGDAYLFSERKVYVFRYTWKTSEWLERSKIGLSSGRN